jgi:protoporphyrinogen/coproporphyrinogen III oxidase
MKSQGAHGGESAQVKGPPPLYSFRQGVGVLPHAIAEQLAGNLRAGACVYALNRVGKPGVAAFEVHASISGKNLAIAAQAIIFATPAYVTSRLIAGLSPAAAHALSGIAYAPAGVVAAGYYTRQFAGTLVGFGFLIPRSEKYRTLGTVWNSSLFPGRAPAGSVAITSFIAGATDPEILERPDEEITFIVERENARILGITGPPSVSFVWKHPKALPQYNLGHAHVVAAIREAERATPGLFFSGNYLEGPAIGKCVEQAFKTAQAARACLSA